MPRQVPDPEMHERLRQQAATLPASPGVYIMRDRAGKALYVGKALSLRNRVRSYFQATRASGKDERANVPFLIENVDHLEVFVTDTEKEALILENNLIKKLKPRYNINLKDDKSFLLVRLQTDTPFPRLELVRHSRRGAGRTFGPYSNASAIRETVSLLSSTLGLRVCKDGEMNNRVRACPLYEMEYCSAPCIKAVTPAAYAGLTAAAIRFLEGDTHEIVARLRASMETAAAAMDFERAAWFRDRIDAIERSVERQKVVATGAADRDVFALARKDSSATVQVLGIRGGALAWESSYHIARASALDAALLEEFLSRFYAGDRFAPAEVHVSELPLESAGLIELLSDRRGSAVKLRVPRRGDARRLLEMAARNATIAEEQHRVRAVGEQAALDELQSALGLLEPPHRIDCFDIANLQGQDTVAAMSVLIAGQPAPALYRHYHIHSLAVGVQDDFRAIGEVVARRYARARDERDLPDLVLIDGGKGQLEAAIASLRRIGLADLPVASIAKARGREGGERIYLPDRDSPLEFPSASRARFLLERVRDEAHRFANSFHARTRSKRATLTGLEGLPGIGKRTIARLMSEYPTLQELSQATPEDLQHRAGLKPAQALAVHDALRNQDPEASRS